MPQPEEIAAILRMHPTGEMEPLLEQALLQPLGSFLRRSAKRFRSQMVEFSFSVSDQGKSSEAVAKDLCTKGAFIIESLHAASMVIDDIEDQSMERRGEPTLFRQVGMPVALNAGNWLYFWPLERMQSWKLPEKQELAIFRCVTESLVRAHFGQAIDVGVPIDSLPQEKVAATCLASMELKTGAFMGLACSLGAILASASDSDRALLEEFGVAFGIALQMFDDIGNLSAREGKPDPKQYEDLRLRRPSWIWACAAQYSHPEDYATFRKVVAALPDSAPLEDWLDRQALRIRAKSLAIENLETAFGPLESRLGEAQSARWIREISAQLKGAYV